MLLPSSYQHSNSKTTEMRIDMILFFLLGFMLFLLFHFAYNIVQKRLLFYLSVKTHFGFFEKSHVKVIPNVELLQNFPHGSWSTAGCLTCAGHALLGFGLTSRLEGLDTEPTSLRQNKLNRKLLLHRDSNLQTSWSLSILCFFRTAPPHSFPYFWIYIFIFT